MDQKTVTVRLKDGYFVASNEKGATLKLGTGSGDAPTPMDAVLMAVAGCTGVDVLSTLNKMRQQLIGLEIVVVGRRRDEHPRFYDKVKIIYHFTGQLAEDKVRRAIELSLDKYCSVSNMLKPQAEIEYDFSIKSE